jgi:hypothetical protein
MPAPETGTNQWFRCGILVVVPVALASIMATATLTMIKDNLTSGFLWSAKPIGYEAAEEGGLRRVQARCQ